MLLLPQCATAAQDFANAGQTMQLHTLTQGRSAEQHPWPDELRLELLHPAGGSMQLDLHANLQQNLHQHLHQHFLQYRHFLRQIWQNRPLQEVQQQIQQLRQERQQRQQPQQARQQALQQQAKQQQADPHPVQTSILHNTARLITAPLASNYAPPAATWGQTLPTLQATWRIKPSGLAKMAVAPAGMQSARSHATPLQFTIGSANTMMLGTIQQHLAGNPFGLINNTLQVARLTRLGPNVLTSMPVAEIHTSPFHAWPGLGLQTIQLRNETLGKDRTKQLNTLPSKQQDKHSTNITNTELRFAGATQRNHRTAYQTVAQVPNQVLNQVPNQVMNHVLSQTLSRTSTQTLNQIPNQTSNQITAIANMGARAKSENKALLFPDLLQKLQALQISAHPSRQFEKNLAQLSTPPKFVMQGDMPSIAAKLMLNQSLANTLSKTLPPTAMAQNWRQSLTSFTFLQYPKLAYAFSQASKAQARQRPDRRQDAPHGATSSRADLSAALRTHQLTKQFNKQLNPQRLASVRLARLHTPSIQSIATGVTARLAAITAGTASPTSMPTPGAAIRTLQQFTQHLLAGKVQASAADVLSRAPSVQARRSDLHTGLFATLQTKLLSNTQPARSQWLSSTLNYWQPGKIQEQVQQQIRQQIQQQGLPPALQHAQAPRQQVAKLHRTVAARIAQHRQPPLRALALLSAKASLQGSSTPITPPSMQIALHIHQPVAQLRRYGQPLVARELRQAALSAPKAQRLQQQLQQQLQTQLQSVERQVHTQIVQEIVQVGTSRDHLRKLMSDTMLAPNLLQTLVARVATALERRASLERYRRG